MSRSGSQNSLLKELIRSLVPITPMGKAMMAGVIIWFINWALVDGETLFGSVWLKRLVDFGSILAIIPFIYFIIQWARALGRTLLWSLRRRLIVTYFLIGALPLLLVVFLIVLIGYIVVMQSSLNLVSRQVDGYLEQSRAAAYSLGRDLVTWDAETMDQDQLRRRLQERVNLLSSIFPDLVVNVRSAGGSGVRISVRGISSEGQLEEKYRASSDERLPDWLDKESEFHGLVIEEDATGGRHVVARDILKLGRSKDLTLSFIYPIGLNLCEHLKHTTDLEVKPSQVLTPLVLTPGGAVIDEQELSGLVLGDQMSGWAPGSLPIYKNIMTWTTGRRLEGDILQVDLAFLEPGQIWRRIEQFQSGSAIGNSVIWAILGLGGLFLLIALTAVFSAVILTRSITGAVHHLYAGTKRIESGDFVHQIPVTGTDQIAELSVSFNQMTRSIRELLEVSAEKQRLDQEMKIAAQVQSQLFPRSVPATTRLDFAPGICIPARSVSGDYFDYLEVLPGVTGIVVADVCGKGVSAALMMANLQAHLRGQVLAYHDIFNFKVNQAAGADQSESRSASAELSARSHPVQRIVHRVNQQVADSVLDASYITLFYAEFNEQNSTLWYTNAGHNPPLLMRKNFEGGPRIERLDRGGTVLGLFTDSTYEVTELSLRPGDVLIAFTDGLVEAHNPQFEEFGEHRVIDILLNYSDQPAAEIERQILKSVMDWISGAEQEDDLTLVIFKVR